MPPHGSFAARTWLRELQGILCAATGESIDSADARREELLRVATLSVGARAKAKWSKWWFLRGRARDLDSLLDRLRRHQVSAVDVIGYLADRMLIVELRQMASFVVADIKEHVCQTSPAVPRQLAPAGFKEVRRSYSYPCGRYPARAVMGYGNSLMLRSLGASSDSVRFQAFPGTLSAIHPDPNSAMSSVFLSHSHLDREFARRLSEDLKVSRIKVWFDEAEIRPGDSLLAKVQSAISEMKYLGVILSPNAVASEWVLLEWQSAMLLEIGERRVRVLPILYQACEIPLFLLGKKYVDFSNPAEYAPALETLLNALLGFPGGVLLTAKQAAKLVRVECSPVGALCGLSQQGVCHQCIVGPVAARGDWSYADVKTGRSSIWILEYFEERSGAFATYGVVDGQIHEFPTGTLETKIRTLNFAFVDSDLAVAAATQEGQAVGAVSTDRGQYLVDTVLKYCLPSGEYIWFVSFFDFTLVRPVLVVEVDSHTGCVIRSYAPHEVRS